MNDGERIGFTVAPGVYDILAQAKKNERYEEHTVHLSGDLCQMAAQATFLKDYGIDVEFNNVYPCVRESEKEDAFKLIWKYKCSGWWNYENEYAELGIATKDVFREALRKWCEDQKD